MRIDEWLNLDSIIYVRFTKLLDLYDKHVDYTSGGKPNFKGNRQEAKRFRLLHKQFLLDLNQIKRKIFTLWNVSMTYTEVENYIFHNYPILLAQEIICRLKGWQEEWITEIIGAVS